jgi:cell division protein ZapE
LKAYQSSTSRHLWRRLFHNAQPKLVRGIYLWGGVGRGKTMLLDLFAAQSGARIRRIHFHHFMRDVHARLRELHDSAQDNPLSIIAADYASSIDVLCLDELLVSDIADAMILGGLFSGLTEKGVTLVITSNLPPDQLYRDGLQRSRFLPAIELLEKITEVVEVDAQIDYRLRTLQSEPLIIRADAEADERMAERFMGIAMAPGLQDGLIEIEGRQIHFRGRHDGVVWFDFAALCLGPRGTLDYIALARQFHTVFLSSVPDLSADDNAVRRFIALVDEFYDRNVKLLLSIETSLEDLYRGERLAFDFRRTLSRLNEMTSRAYLELPHRP